MSETGRAGAEQETAVAVIGMAGRFPGAADVDAAIVVTAVGNSIGAIVVEQGEVHGCIDICDRLAQPFPRFRFSAEPE